MNAYTDANIVYISDILMYFLIYLEKVASGWVECGASVVVINDRSNVKTNLESYYPLERDIVHTEKEFTARIIYPY